jgi:hypothetical protein
MVGAFEKGEGTMGYSLEEHLENGDKILLGEPFCDLTVAKVIASRRASRTGRIVVVFEDEEGVEVARYDSNGAPFASVGRMRAAEPIDLTPESVLRHKTSA